MINFAIPPRLADECTRLSALHALGVLDTAPEVAFDRMINLVAAIWDVPIAALSLVDANRQWFKARKGLDAERVIFFQGSPAKCPPVTES